MVPGAFRWRRETGTSCHRWNLENWSARQGTWTESPDTTTTGRLQTSTVQHCYCYLAKLMDSRSDRQGMHVGLMRQHRRMVNESTSIRSVYPPVSCCAFGLQFHQALPLLSNTIVLIVISAEPKQSVIAGSQIEPAEALGLVFPLVWKPKPTDSMDIRPPRELGC